MRVGEYCTREVAFATRGMGIGEAAQVMRAEHVGDLVVIEESAKGRRPVGIVTDRDLVMEVLAPGLDPQSVTVGDLPTRELAVATVDDDLMDALARMGALGVRRMPVVDAEGLLAGILAADDVLEVVAELSDQLVKIAARGVAAEVRRRPGQSTGHTAQV